MLWNAAAWDACGTQSLSLVLMTAEGTADTVTGVALVKVVHKASGEDTLLPQQECWEGMPKLSVPKLRPHKK